MLRAVLNIDVTEPMENLPLTFTLKKGAVVEVLQTFGELIGQRPRSKDTGLPA